MKATCPTCCQSYSFESDLIGAQSTCQQCGTVFTLQPDDALNLPITSPLTDPDQTCVGESESQTRAYTIPALSIILILFGLLDLCLALFASINITSWMGAMSRYSAWLSIGIGVTLFKLARESSVRCPTSKSGDPNLFELTATEISVAITASELIVEVRGECPRKWIPSPPPIGTTSILLREITGLAIHKVKWFVDGVIVTTTDQQSTGIRVGSLAPRLVSYIQRASAGSRFKFTRIDGLRKAERGFKYIAVSWLGVLITAWLLQGITDSPLKPKTHSNKTDWSQVAVMDSVSYGKCSRGEIKSETPFIVYAKVNSRTEEENVYQCDLVVRGYEDEIDSNDFFAASPKRLQENDYFEANAFFDQNVEFTTLLKQIRSIPKLDVVDLQIRPKNEVIKDANSANGKDFTLEIVGAPLKITVPKSLGLSKVDREKLDKDTEAEELIVTDEESNNALGLLNIDYGPNTKSDRKSFAKQIAKLAISGINEDLKASEEVELDDLTSLTIAGQDAVQINISNWGDLSGKIYLIYHTGGTLMLMALGVEDWVKEASTHLKSEAEKAKFEAWPYPGTQKKDEAAIPLPSPKSITAKDQPTDIPSEAPPERPTKTEKKVTTPEAPRVSEVEKNKSKLLELKLALAKVDAALAKERACYQEALAIINRLTNFKRTPVAEGSPAYQQCYAASKIIGEIERNAPSLKEKRSKIQEDIATQEGSNR